MSDLEKEWVYCSRYESQYSSSSNQNVIPSSFLYRFYIMLNLCFSSIYTKYLVTPIIDQQKCFN